MKTFHSVSFIFLILAFLALVWQTPAFAYQTDYFETLDKRSFGIVNPLFLYDFLLSIDDYNASQSDFSSFLAGWDSDDQYLLNKNSWLIAGWNSSASFKYSYDALGFTRSQFLNTGERLIKRTDNFAVEIPFDDPTPHIRPILAQPLASSLVFYYLNTKYNSQPEWSIGREFTPLFHSGKSIGNVVHFPNASDDGVDRLSSYSLPYNIPLYGCSFKVEVPTIERWLVFDNDGVLVAYVGRMPYLLSAAHNQYEMDDVIVWTFIYNSALNANAYPSEMRISVLSIDASNRTVEKQLASSPATLSQATIQHYCISVDVFDGVWVIGSIGRSSGNIEDYSDIYKRASSPFEIYSNYHWIVPKYETIDQ